MTAAANASSAFATVATAAARPTVPSLKRRPPHCPLAAAVMTAVATATSAFASVAMSAAATTPTLPSLT